MPRRQKSVVENVLGFVAQARAAASKAFQSLQAEIGATRKRLETLIAEERSFRLDLFGSGGPGRPRRGGPDPSAAAAPRLQCLPRLAAAPALLFLR
jgi:hypothetical protein